MKITRLSALVTTIFLVACASPDRKLASLARERLALAPEVAWYKHSRGLPIYDARRENKLLETVTDAGGNAGLDRKIVRCFFTAEMEFSRHVQGEWINAWRKNRQLPAKPPRDLSTDLRPRIDRINRRQIRMLAAGATPPSRAQLSAISARFLPKNCRSKAPDSSPSTPPVTAQR